MLLATQNEAWEITHVGPYALVMLVALLLTTQVLGWAAGIAGGFSLSTVSAFRNTSIAAGAGAVVAGRALARRLRNRGRPEAGDAVTGDASKGTAIGATRNAANAPRTAN